MSAFLSAHRHAAGDAVRRLLRSPLGSILSLAAMAIALALPAGFFVALDTLRSVVDGLSSQPEISLFLAPDAGKTDAADIDKRLRDSAAGPFRFVPRDEALKRLQESTGAGDLIAGLPKNPLPDAFVLRPSGAPATLDALAKTFAAWPKIAHVQVDTAWARRLDAALRLGRQATLLFAAVIAAGLVAVVFNTIRLQRLARQEEIEVALLIGATRAFVARPFLWLGTLQGLLGGMLAVLLVAAAFTLLAGPAGELFSLYGKTFGLRGPSAGVIGLTIAAGGLLGWTGAWLSTRDLSMAGSAGPSD